MTKQVTDDMRSQLFGFVKVTLKEVKSIVTKEEEGDDRTPCPNCGAKDAWSFRQYSNVQCNCCHSKFKNLGIYGLEPLNPLPKSRPFRIFGVCIN